MRKTYKIRVACGDGRPVDDIITAKNGFEVQELAKAKHPAARAVHILGLAEEQLANEHPFFSDEPPVTHLSPEEDEMGKKIRRCVELRSKGKTHLQIAIELGISKTTAGRWLKLYG
jgi:hypothetical protein